jgi:hypothetical protein
MSAKKISNGPGPRRVGQANPRVGLGPDCAKIRTGRAGHHFSWAALGRAGPGHKNEARFEPWFPVSIYTFVNYP